MSRLYDVLNRMKDIILNPLSISSTTSWETFNGSWTAPKSGIGILKLQKNSSSGYGTFYLKDSTENMNTVAYFSGEVLSNYQNTKLFVAEKGHTYTAEFDSGSFQNITIRLYPWGG